MYIHKVKNLSDLREDEDEVSASQQQEDLLIVGTVFKQQERKPSILKELSEPSEDGKLVVTDLENYCKSTTNQGSRSARLSPQSMTYHECMCSSMLVVTL